MWILRAAWSMEGREIKYSTLLAVDTYNINSD